MTQTEMQTNEDRWWNGSISKWTFYRTWSTIFPHFNQVHKPFCGISDHSNSEIMSV